MNPKINKIEKAFFAGGCFWGVEYYLQNTKGIIETQVGFMGGNKDNPTYAEVCEGSTGHAEVVAVTYNNADVNFEDICKLFFEIHDPSQINRQGPDIGNQYRSEIFCTTEQQKEKADKLKQFLINKGHTVNTKISAATTFWPAEDYHQKYYGKNGKLPYCHIRIKKF